MTKEQREEIDWHWIKENAETIKLIARLKREGFEVERYLRDYLKGEAKNPEHYWAKEG